jgi:hypothetical protein
MVIRSHELEALSFKRLLKETRAIDRSIGLGIRDLDETSIQTRALIDQTWRVVMTVDRLFKR